MDSAESAFDSFPQFLLLASLFLSGLLPDQMERLSMDVLVSPSQDPASISHQMWDERSFRCFVPASFLARPQKSQSRNKPCLLYFV